MKQAKTARGRRIQKKKEAKVVETEPKKALFLRGGKSSQVGQSVLRDLRRLKTPDGHALSRKNEDVRLFEEAGEAKLEHLMRKFDCSLFAFTSHNKKRPNNLILGRTFDGNLLDVMEFGVLDYAGIDSFPGAKPMFASKPCFIFQGPEFDDDERYRAFKSLILDFFRGRVVPKIALAGMDKVCVCTAVGEVEGATAGAAAASGSASTPAQSFDPLKCAVKLRFYLPRLKKASGGTRLPRVELLPTGPSLDLSFRRERTAKAELLKEAMRVARVSAVKAKRVKNVAQVSL